MGRLLLTAIELNYRKAVFAQIAADILRSETGGVVFYEQFVTGGTGAHREKSVDGMNAGDVV